MKVETVCWDPSVMTRDLASFIHDPSPSRPKSGGDGVEREGPGGAVVDCGFNIVDVHSTFPQETSKLPHGVFSYLVL